MFIPHSVNSDWLFKTQSRVLQADWFILEFNEMANLNIKTPCCNISGGAKKMAQLLVGRNFKTTQQNYTKLQTTISQHAFNHIVNFQYGWTANVEMTVA